MTIDDDDLFSPTLTRAPATSPLIRGAALAVVTVSISLSGCNPGATAPDSGYADVGHAPGTDTGPPPHDSALDAGLDATPGVDASGDAALDGGHDSDVDADRP